MKKYVTYIITGIALSFIVFFGCNKYKAVINSRISGKVMLHDTLNVPIVLPLSKSIVFVNNGPDTTSWTNQTTTDSLGNFTMAYAGRDSGTVFVNQIRAGLKISGKRRVGPPVDSTRHVVVNIYLKYDNGLSIVFSGNGGPISNYPFRLYTNRIAASVDSAKFAYLSGTTNMNGNFHRYNAVANKYYIVAKDSIKGKKYKLLDSITLMSKGLFIKNVTVN